MFRGWDFLLGEIWSLLLIATLLGLVAGWLFWGRRVASLSNELEETQYTFKEKQVRITSLEDELRFTKAKHREELDSYIGGINERDMRIEAFKSEMELKGNKPVEQGKPAKSQPTRRPVLTGTASAHFDTVADTISSGEPAVSVISGLNEADKGPGRKPTTMKSPRDGMADDLKQIRGVGPKLERMLNDLGFYHFDQVALWGKAEVAWVDSNLEGFSGRVSRDNWVAQARALVAKRQIV